MNFEHPIRDLILVLLAGVGIFGFTVANGEILAGAFVLWIPQLAAFGWAAYARRNGTSIKGSQSIVNVGCLVAVGCTLGMILIYLISPWGYLCLLPTIVATLVIQHIQPADNNEA